MAKEYDDMTPAERKRLRDAEWDRIKSGNKKKANKEKE